MKKFFPSFLFFVILILFEKSAFAQKNKIDSLRTFLKDLPASSSFSKETQYRTDTVRINALNSLAWELRNEKPETAFILYTQALNLTYTIFKSEGNQSPLGRIREKKIAQSYNYLGLLYYHKGNFPLSLDYHLKSLKIWESLNDKKGISTVIGNIGNAYKGQSDYPKALDYYFKALKIDEELGNKKGIARHYGNIGIVYRNQRDCSKALNYYSKALKINEELGNQSEIAGQYCNIGVVYSEQNNYNEALNCLFKALKLAKGLENKNMTATILGDIGNVYDLQSQIIKSGEYSPRKDSLREKALNFYLKALELSNELKDKNGTLTHLGDIGQIYSVTKRYKEAEEYLQKAIALGLNIHALNYTSDFEKLLSELYTKTNQSAKALTYYKMYVATKDSIFNEENTKKTVRSEMNFEFEKKQTEQKIEQEKENAIANTEKQKQKIILLFVFVFAGFMYNRWRVTKKQKQLIEQQKKLVDTAYHQIEVKNKEITDSISYASRIQLAMLTSEEYIGKALSPLKTDNEKENFFILYQPKDIVSGDFYWAYNPPFSLYKNEKCFYIATADCTGHGVPGAFMSLLNINFLNENIIERNITEPNKILNEQRKEIIKALNPKGTENSRDGMDCVLCKFDYSLFEGGKAYVTLTYSSANNSLWIIRKKNSDLTDTNFKPLELIEGKTDKMPVGKYSEADKEFSQQTIQLQKGDTVYTFTDGYADQFGGPNGKKFKHKQLKNLLLSINHISMVEQQTILKQTINNWKGNLEQVDDILVIGIKI